MPFKSGQSGNPGGRPKMDPEVMAMLRAATPRAVKKLASLIDSEDGRIAALACNSILDRAFGKPTQPISGDDEHDPISVRDYTKLSKAERDTLRALAMKAAS